MTDFALGLLVFPANLVADVIKWWPVLDENLNRLCVKVSYPWLTHGGDSFFINVLYSSFPSS